MTASFPRPLSESTLSPEMTELLRQHFWCDFSDVIPALTWDEKKPAN